MDSSEKKIYNIKYDMQYTCSGYRIPNKILCIDYIVSTTTHFRIYFYIKILGIVVGLIYLRLSYNQENIQNFAGLLFFIVTNLSFASLQGVIFVSDTLLYMFVLEYTAGQDSPILYFILY